MIEFDPHTKGKSLLIDSNPLCTLECYSCARQDRRDRGQTPSFGNHIMTPDELRLVIKHYEYISFCGQMSDPIFNPHFIEMLEILHENNKWTEIRTAATSKKFNLKWYEKAFNANPNAIWIFGIDGVDDSSALYRVNQDTNLLFEAMKLGVSLGLDIKWQYLIFSYNESNIEEAVDMAKDMGVELHLTLSSRFFRKDDPFKPRNSNYYIERTPDWWNQ